MNIIANINKANFFYKMGVLCGNTLLTTYKFADFEEMMRTASDISNKYKSDMQRCAFVIQAFKDNSYDFENSCFCQIHIKVNGIEEKKENIASKILSDYEGEVQRE